MAKEFHVELLWWGRLMQGATTQGPEPDQIEVEHGHHRLSYSGSSRVPAFGLGS